MSRWAFVAQWLEHLSRKQGVASSILAEGFNFFVGLILHYSMIDNSNRSFSIQKYFNINYNDDIVLVLSFKKYLIFVRMKRF